MPARALAVLLAVVPVLLGGAAPPAAQPPAARPPAARPPAAQPLAAQPLAAQRAAPQVTAEGAVLWDPEHDLVLYDKDADVGRPMASTTKIMTALLAIEAGTSDDIVTVSPEAAARGGASVGLRPGQEVPMRSLLAGLVLRSGNDAAQAVAEHVAGSEDAFVGRMNARAEELGLTDTLFLNSSGLTADLEHRASPLDLARLAHAAMAQPLFAELAGATEATVPVLGAMDSRNELLGSYAGASGVKTGFTSVAGLCLVASATREGRTLYAVLLGSADSFADAAVLLDHGFDDFRRVEPLPPGGVATRYRWPDTDVAVLLPERLSATVPVSARVTWRLRLRPTVERPVAATTPIGTGELVVEGQVIAEQTLVTAAEVGPRAPSGAPAAEAGAAVQEALRAFALLHVVDRDVAPQAVAASQGRT